MYAWSTPYIQLRTESVHVALLESLKKKMFAIIKPQRGILHVQDLTDCAYQKRVDNHAN